MMLCQIEWLMKHPDSGRCFHQLSYVSSYLSWAMQDLVDCAVSQQPWR